MNACVRLSRDDKVKTFGMRASAVPYREQVESALNASRDVTIDFGGYEATQSFVDELIGSLILRYGRGVVGRLVFENCPEEVKGIIRFVARDRISQVSNPAAA